MTQPRPKSQPQLMSRTAYAIPHWKSDTAITCRHKAVAAQGKQRGERSQLTRFLDGPC